jgi:hypothetical protein
MRWPYVWRKTAEDEVAVWKAEAGRQRRRAEQAERTAKSEVANRRTIAELYADLCDSHGLPVPVDPNHPDRQRAQQTMARFDQEQARKAADRIARLRKGVAAAREEAAAERHRADQLQGRLDDAVGLKPFRIEDSRWYQPGYRDQEADAR